MREIRQQLFFAGNPRRAVQTRRACVFRIINAVNELLLPGNKHERLLAGHVRHQERGKKIIPPVPVIFERHEQFVFALP